MNDFFIIFALRELKRKQALQRCNLSAIDFLRYTVTECWRMAFAILFWYVTGIAIWLKKPTRYLVKTIKTTFYQ